MLTGLCVPGVAHEPTDPIVWDLMHSRQVPIARVELTPGASPQQLANVIDQFVSRPWLSPLFLIGAGAQGKNNYPDSTAPNGSRRYEPHEVAACGGAALDHIRSLDASFASTFPSLENRTLFEALNEGDIGTMDYIGAENCLAVDYGEAARQLHTTLRTQGFQGPVLAGSVANLNQRGFDYLDAMEWDRLPPDLVATVHWYTDGPPLGPLKGHDGYTPETAWQELERIVGETRAIAVTEFGFSTCHGGFTWDEQAIWTRYVLAFLKQRNALCGVSYQVNDGPDPEDVYAGYGWWTYPDRLPKPVQIVFAEFA